MNGPRPPGRRRRATCPRSCRGGCNHEPIAELHPETLTGPERDGRPGADELPSRSRRRWRWRRAAAGPSGTDARPGDEPGGRRARRGRVAGPATAGGLLVAASVPPWGFWILAVPGFGLLTWRLGGLGRRGRAAAGAGFGLGLFVPTLFWMTEFHAVGYAAAALCESAFLVAMAMAVPPARVALALPGALVLAEAARDAWPFGGVPLGGPALGQAAGPLAPAACLGGALLVAGLAAAAGAAAATVAAALARRGRRAGALLAAAGALAVVVITPLAGRAAAPSASAGDGTPLRVALVQGGGERGLRAVDTDPGAVFDRQVAQTATVDGPVDLVLWPENTVDVPRLDGSVEEAELAATARRLGATVVAGITEDVGPEHFDNVAVAWSPAGRITGRYTKVHRVPFGEYVPGRALIEKLADLSVLPRDAVAGHGTGALDTAAGRVGVTISYEVFFASRARSAIRHGGRVLLVPTNAASFRTSQVPTQEVAAARLRAWETGRWVLQAAPTGYSAVVDPRGRVLARSRLGAARVLHTEARLLSDRTPYVRAGDGPVLAAALLTLAGAHALARRAARRAAPAGPRSRGGEAARTMPS